MKLQVIRADIFFIIICHWCIILIFCLYFLYRYLHDVIYITCFVQLTSIISRKFRWIYAVVIPAFAVYKGWGLIKGFLPQGCEGVEEDERTRKKREKMGKKALRGKVVKAKAR
ncbi:putative SRP-independent targeting protein 2/TMEM208 [Helianthus annuus]|nr:putative SRP-independent targeting protein 2/TMEM208 [Helianthus annuus]